MSSAVLTSAALGRPFAFDKKVAEARSIYGPALKKSICAGQSASKNQPPKIPPAGVIPASRLAIRPAPEMVSSGSAQIDALTGGLPRGSLTEICGPASSGRTTLLLSALAAATRRGEFCALVDAGDVLDPYSAAAAGIELDRLLWVRCAENPHQTKSHYAEKPLEQLLRTTDLLLESGGFGLIALDLGDLPPQAARRIPLTTWFRFRRAVEHTPTILLAIERQSTVGSCSSLLLKLAAQEFGMKPLNDLQFCGPAHTQLLAGLTLTAEIARSRGSIPGRVSQVRGISFRRFWEGHGVSPTVQGPPDAGFSP
jgi:recA bacterial DNA recombination protein